MGSPPFGYPDYSSNEPPPPSEPMTWQGCLIMVVILAIAIGGALFIVRF